MPSKHIEKTYAQNAYYHAFNRGVNKRTIFIDQDDYAVFLNLLKRYLGKAKLKDKQGREYPNYHEDIQLLAFCLMPNHYHLFLFQRDNTDSITKLMRGVCTAYTGYFNKKHGRVGHLFQGHFKASMISNDAYLQHITRYIHLNPEQYKQWEFSSLPYYLGTKKADWVNPKPILELFGRESYEKFLEDYKDHREILKEIKADLADN